MEESTRARRLLDHTFARYLAFQVPGCLAVVLVMGVLWWWRDVSPWIGAMVLAAWIVKDLLLYPLLARAYERAPSTTAERRVIGARAVVTETLAPEGWVRVGSELWRARIAPGAEPLERGRTVRVRAVDGLRLVVEPE